MEEEHENKPVYEFDFDSIPASHIKQLHQEGNYLHGVTDTGVKFRQHIKQGKRLNKIGDKYILEDVEIV